MAQILIVEDQPIVGGRIARLLGRDGRHQATHEVSGLRAVERILTAPPDLVILDLGLPDLDGLEVLRRVRPHYRGPILILTGRVGVARVVEGLRAGAEDYVAKPVPEEVLLALVERRLQDWQVLGAPSPAPPQREGPLQVGPLEVDPVARTANVAGVPLALTDRELDLLAVLARAPGVVHTRADLEAKLRACGCAIRRRSLDLLLSRLRAKLGDSGERQEWLRTVYGRGVMLRDRPGG